MLLICALNELQTSSIYWPKILTPHFYISKIWKLCQNLRSIDINIVCGLHSWTVKAQKIAIEFVIIQPWPLLLKSMLSDFDMFSGFICCKLSIHMFSRVSWVNKIKKKVVWGAMHVCRRTHKSRWHSYNYAQFKRGLFFITIFVIFYYKLFSNSQCCCL
jgi:hypothetical protein